MTLHISNLIIFFTKNIHKFYSNKRPHYPLLLTLLSGCYFRFRYLNQLNRSFDGEISPYMAGATNLKGIILANAGVNGPWAPLGYLYYIPIYFNNLFFGSSILSVRLASAQISILNIILVYLLAKKIHSNFAGLIASAFLALDPMQIFWGRSDIYCHGSTASISIVLALYLTKNLNNKTSNKFIILFPMALSFHQYPSGQIAVFIPFVLLSLKKLLYKKEVKFLKEFSLYTIGFILWIFGFFLKYRLAYGNWHYPNMINQFGQRTSWSQSEGFIKILSKIINNLFEIITSFFYKMSEKTHQTIIPIFETDYFNVNQQSVIFFSIPFITFAFFVFFKNPRKNFSKYGILFACCLCSIIPAIFSSHSYPKRYSNLFPFLYIMGSISISDFISYARQKSRILYTTSLSLITITFALYFLINNHLFFSGKNFEYGTPIETKVSKFIEERIEDDMIILYRSINHFNYGKYTYLLTDAFNKNKDKVFIWDTGAVRKEKEEEHYIKYPKDVTDYISNSFLQQWTMLREKLPIVKVHKNWKKVFYIFDFELHKDKAKILAKYKKAVMRSCKNAEFKTIAEINNYRKVEYIVCNIKN